MQLYAITTDVKDKKTGTIIIKKALEKSGAFLFVVPIGLQAFR